MRKVLIERGFILPLVVVGIVPSAIALSTNGFAAATVSSAFVAMPLFALGLGLLLGTTRLFDAHGGSLAPWNPPDQMVTIGPYRHVRNPMILGIFLMLAAESIAISSAWIGLWLAFFVLAQQSYIVFHEEPLLRARFGAAYERYCRDVPRWLPRRIRRTAPEER